MSGKSGRHGYQRTRSLHRYARLFGGLGVLALLLAGAGVYLLRPAASHAQADPNCPAGFTCQDIGPIAHGYESTVNGTLTVHAAGVRALYGTTDQFRLITQARTGDLQVSVELIKQSMQGHATGPEAGLIVRQSANPQSPFFGLFEYPENNPEKQPLPTLRIFYRLCQGCQAYQANKYYPTLLPVYLMIQRQGELFSAATSKDGITWHLLPGSLTQFYTLPAAAIAGIAQNSYLQNTLGTASYAHLAAGPISITPIPPQPAHPCPTGWGCQDVGDPSPVGDQTYSNGTWTNYGAGSDINNNLDRFHFVWQTLPGNGAISAHVTAQQNTSVNAKAGVLLRQNLDPAAAYYGVFVTPGGVLTVQYRLMENQGTIQAAKGTGKAPIWLRVTRSPDAANSALQTYRAYSSADGVNWTLVPGSTVTMNLSGSVLAGMGADANAIRVQSAVTYDHVAIG